MAKKRLLSPGVRTAAGWVLVVLGILLATSLLFPGGFASSALGAVGIDAPGVAVVMGEKVSCSVDVVNPSGTLFNPTGDPPEFSTLPECRTISECRYSEVSAFSIGEFFRDNVQVEMIDSKGKRLDSVTLKVFEQSSPLGFAKTAELTGCTFDGTGSLVMFDENSDVLDRVEFDAI